MGGHHTPALGGAHPGLALSASQLAGVALKLQVDSGHVSPISCNELFEYGSLQTLYRASSPESPDFGIAVEVFCGAKPKGVRTVPKQFIQHCHVVGNQGLLITIALNRYFCQYVREINVHS